MVGLFFWPNVYSVLLLDRAQDTPLQFNLWFWEESMSENEEIIYHAVEKEGAVTAIWEMQGRKHLRTIDPRSEEGQDILRLYTTEHAEHHEAVVAAPEASEVAST